MNRHASVETFDRLLGSLRADAADIQSLRRDLHAHPELAFQEQRTAELIAAKLASWDIPVHRGLGGTGVVGTIRAGSGQRGLGLRADIDALPITEQNQFGHRSVHAGRMHACGHDGHTAMLLAAARHLAAHRDFDGSVYVIFQPAEEAGGGARSMMRAHNWPGMPAGEFALAEGPVMASSNEFRVLIRGKGAHAAMPHNGIDPVPVACQMVQAFQTILTRNKRPIDAAVISVTMIRAGEVINAVPDSCELQGTVRTFTLEVLDLIEQRMRQIAGATAEAFGAHCEFTFHRSYPPTVNHARETEFLRQLLVESVGAARVHVFEPTMGAEDFSFFLQHKPGCYFLLGNGEGQHRLGGHGAGPCMLHSPSYDFNDALIPVGASVWIQLARAWLAHPV